MDYEFFNYIRYESIFLLLVLIGLFVNAVFFKRKTIINWFATVSISFICVVVGTLSFIMGSILIDELNLSSDLKDTFIFMGIIVLAIVNSLISYKSKTNSIDKMEKLN
ncbi:putative membrane protein [Bacillus thermophilus]|uniref:Membrane protein n=1 Tax=Siminovitchia thermophila TaxID=1245522 RepID=A0ABS2R3J9_9BACI|nr:putative membrane protein [Siminovitchia thermophila]ONK23069.1 hypothetical protein BLX87_12685 [Bacillus sp. VT-16-64]